MRVRIVRRTTLDHRTETMPPPEIVRAVERAKTYRPHAEALAIAWRLSGRLHVAPFRKFIFCGSLRREAPQVGDVDILILPENPDDGSDILDAGERAAEDVEWRGAWKLHMTYEGFPIDILLTTPEAWGAALQYLTGSRWHNIALRADATSLGLRLNEHGVWRGETRIAGRTEAGVYEALGRRWIHPRYRTVPDPGAKR